MHLQPPVSVGVDEQTGAPQISRGHPFGSTHTQHVPTHGRDAAFTAEATQGAKLSVGELRRHDVQRRVRRGKFVGVVELRCTPQLCVTKTIAAQCTTAGKLFVEVVARSFTAVFFDGLYQLMASLHNE